MPKSWVIRSGRYGERDAWALQNGFSGGGWSEIGDLTACTTKEDVVAATRVAFPNAPDGRLSNHAGQLWALRGRIEVGDLMVLPLKTTKQIALGRVTSGYHYLSDQDDPDKRHVVSVDWQRHDLPRTAVKQDLLYTLGSAISIFAPSKNHAIDRLEHLLANGVDPGQIPSIAANWTGGLASNPAVLVDADGVVDEPELSADIEDVALTQIEARISEEFSGHGLTALVSDLLAAQGFVCEQSTPGPDGGVDIIAGRGPLGLDAPRLVVQVKSGGQVGDPIVTQLQGVMSKFGAEQGLLVAWGGLTKPARDSLRNDLRVRLWESSQVVEAVKKHYEHLSDEVRTKIPLKRVRMLNDAGL